MSIPSNSENNGEVEVQGMQEYSEFGYAQRTLSDGVYRLAVGAASNKVIEVAGSDMAENAKIDIWDNGNVPAQKFNLEYKDGYYKITARHTGKSLTVKNGNLEEGAEIVQSTYQGLDSQKWMITDSNINGLVISLVSNPGLSIAIEGNIENGAKLVLAKTEYNNNQMFYIFNENDITRGPNDGVYRLAVGAASNKVIEVAGSNTSDNAKIDIWDNGNVSAQKFNLEYKEGYYKITARHTGKSLTVKNEDLKEGAEIVQSTYEGLDSQKWIITDSNKNGLVISLYSNPQLSIAIEGNIENGAKLVLATTEYNNNQMFYMFNENESARIVNDGTYEFIVSANQQKGMEVAGSSTSDNAKVGIWDYGNAEAQKFNIEYKEGYYKITAKHTGKSLTVKDGNLASGTEVVQSTYQGLDSQKWLITDSNINGLVISLYSNPNLTLTIDGKIDNGDKIVLKPKANNNNQMFYFIQTVEISKPINNGLYKLLVGANPNKSVEVAGSNSDNGAKIDIWDYGNAKAQKFNIEYIEGGYYKITASHSDKSLSVQDNKVQSGVAIVQDEYKGEIGQMWIIRDSNINGLVISPLSRPDLAVTIENSIQNGSRLILESMQNNDRQMLYFYTTNFGVDIDSSKYPGISESIAKLADAHPNWQFEILYTTLDFNTAVTAEYEYEGKQGNTVDTTVYKGDWIAPNPYVSENWASASYNAIAYFMDPRNFLNDVDVFQFVDLADYYNSGATLDSIQYQVNGTFLENYAEDIRVSCENQGINPYYVIARLFQEQGKNGSVTIYMDGGDGKTYFNPFNIGAVLGDDFNTALAKAKEQGWDSMQKGIEGGIKFVKQNYIDAKQNTLYLNKFDVNPASPGGFYTHQYMQNLSAAYSEARTFRSAYVSTGTLDNTIKFIIPVYENMPEVASPRPTGSGTSSEPDVPSISDQGPMSVQVYDIDTSLKVRSGPGTNYEELERLQNGTILLSIERYSNGWQKVITPSGTVGYCSGDYLQFINDVTNCNERIEISTSTSVNIRIGPGQNYTSLGTFKNGTKGTRILKDAYTADGYTWDLVILDDGTKGFVASKYLRVL